VERDHQGDLRAPRDQAARGVAPAQCAIQSTLPMLSTGPLRGMVWSFTAIARIVNRVSSSQAVVRARSQTPSVWRGSGPGSDGHANGLRTGLCREIAESPCSARRQAHAETHACTYPVRFVKSPAIAIRPRRWPRHGRRRFVAHRDGECNGAGPPRSQSKSRLAVSIADCQSVSEPPIYRNTTCAAAFP
jgi:hypothetical protein